MIGRRRRVRPALAATAALAAVAALAGPPSGAAAARPGLAGPCPDSDGVTVVVDFQGLGGETAVRCAPGDQSTGHAALVNAGFAVTGTARWGDAFVCRIDGKPGTDAEDCVDTPPETAYWSYWHADNGGDWIHSQYGAAQHTPPPGSFEGWSFAQDHQVDPPRTSPVRPAPTEPEPPDPEPSDPEPTNPEPTNPDPSDPGPGGSDRDGGDLGPESPGNPGDTGDAGNPAPDATPSERDSTGLAGPTLAGPARPGADPPATTDPRASPTSLDLAASSDGGPPVSMLIGLALVLALAGAAGVVAHRRRRAG